MKQFKGLWLALALFGAGCDDDDNTSGAGGAGGGADGSVDSGAGGEGGMGGVGGMGGEGGMGGGGGRDCAQACADLGDCAGRDDLCPGITPDNKAAFIEGCLPACEASPALIGLVNPTDCAGTVGTLSNVNPQFAEACEGGGGMGGEGGMGGDGGMGGGGMGGDGGMGGGGMGGDGGMGGGGMGGDGGMGGEPVVCEPSADSFPGDAWAPCAADGGSWVQLGANPPGTIARIAGFESIADRLWRNDAMITPNDFIEAQLTYSEENGLGSRLVRRNDSHLPQPEGIDCRDAMAAQPYPEYCVGPVRMLPIINDAFDRGAQGDQPRLQAARIEATLLWFLYVSVYKEINTCKTTIADCDSGWAYYGGGANLADPLGYGAYVAAIDAGTHAAVFNGLLAVNCWRGLDNGATAADLELAGRAYAQTDVALDRSLALIFKARAEEAAGLGGGQKAAADAFLRIIGEALDRAVRAADVVSADALAAAVSAENIDYDAAIAAVETAIPCAY